MTTFREPLVTDADVMAQISDARSANGVHIYLNEAINKSGFSMKTPIADLDATQTNNLNWTSFARATGPGEPKVTTVLCNDATSYCIESGADGRDSKPYMAKNENNYWSQPQEAELPDEYHGQKDDYLVMTLRLVYPYKDASGNAAVNNELSGEFNGKQFPNTLKFNTQDLKHLARNVQNHANRYADVEVLEHHFEYTGITAGLEPGSPLRSLQFADLTHLSAGGYAVITGKFEQHEATFSGIVIGVGTMEGNSPVTGTKHFSNYSDPNKEYTFKVILSDTTTIITSGQEKEELTAVLVWDNFAWLIVQNINIVNLEIYSGRRPHV